MFVAYILRSLKDASYYYGHTEDINALLMIHNKGRERYTKGHLPYLVHDTEEFETRKEAAARERFFKSIDGDSWLHSEGIIK